MAIRLHNLSKWWYLGEGEAFHFSNDKRRIIALEVNSPGPVALYATTPAEDVASNPEKVKDEQNGRDRIGANLEPQETSGSVTQFIGQANGWEAFEFGVDGPFDLTVVGEGGCYIYSADSMDIATRIEAPIVFTRMITPRERNPHEEYLAWIAQHNQRMFEERMTAEFERRTADLERRYAQERHPRATAEAARKKVPTRVEQDTGDDEYAGQPPDGGVPDEEVDGGDRGHSKGRKKASEASKR